MANGQANNKLYFVQKENCAGIKRGHQQLNIGCFNLYIRKKNPFPTLTETMKTAKNNEIKREKKMFPLFLFLPNL